MPTYAYECKACGAEQEHHMSMSERKDTMPCPCGAIAEHFINWRGDSFMKGHRRPFKLDGTCVPIGWEHGNTDVGKQQARYEKLIAEKKKLARQNDKQAIKGGIRHIASVPRELFRMRRNQYGSDYLNPAALSEKELVEQLKSDDLYLHKDG